MRKAFLMLAIAACATSPLALAQDIDAAGDMQTQSADNASAGKPKSAFGRVMSLLTHALQEASAGNAPDLSAAGVTVTVTPITGRSTFAAHDDDGTTPAAADAVAAGAAPAAASTPLAVQTGDGGAD